MANSINQYDDIIQVTDIFERFEELEGAQEALREEFEDDEANNGVDFDNWVRNQIGFSDEDKDELTALQSLIDDLRGMGGDEKWRGDWYPANLIRYSYFETVMDEMVADCYNLDALELPSFVTLTLDYVALQQDYSSVDVSSVEYFCR